MRKEAWESWIKSILERLPLRSFPPAEQCRIAKNLTLQPAASWCQLSFMSVQALLKAQSLETGMTTDSKLAHELMAAMTWDYEVVAPDTRNVPDVLGHQSAPLNILSDLGHLQTQTHYLQIERYLDPQQREFLVGGWLMFDIHRDTNEKIAVLLLDLLVDGQPNREIVFEFTLEPNYMVAVDRFLDDVTFTLNWPSDDTHALKRSAQKASLLNAVGVLNLFHTTLIVKANDLKLARAISNPQGTTGFRVTDLNMASLRGSHSSIRNH